MDGLPIASVLPMPVEEDSPERLAALFDAHHERLYRLTGRLTSNADDALDLVQETFLRPARRHAAVPTGCQTRKLGWSASCSTSEGISGAAWRSASNT